MPKLIVPAGTAATGGGAVGQGKAPRSAGFTPHQLQKKKEAGLKKGPAAAPKGGSSSGPLVAGASKVRDRTLLMSFARFALDIPRPWDA